MESTGILMRSFAHRQKQSPAGFLPAGPACVRVG